MSQFSEPASSQAFWKGLQDFASEIFKSSAQNYLEECQVKWFSTSLKTVSSLNFLDFICLIPSNVFGFQPFWSLEDPIPDPKIPGYTPPVYKDFELFSGDSTDMVSLQF